VQRAHPCETAKKGVGKPGAQFLNGRVHGHHLDLLKKAKTREKKKESIEKWWGGVTFRGFWGEKELMQKNTKSSWGGKRKGQREKFWTSGARGNYSLQIFFNCQIGKNLLRDLDIVSLTKEGLEGWKGPSFMWKHSRKNERK